MNNSVKYGSELIGFRCFTCGNIFQSMWGTKCNGCREADRKHNELIQALKSLKEKGETK